ncbi:thioredoxin domain-containing protein [Candidatus Palauibacter sp.]|uniref:thioredoxin domain-containing protein n=1 Tax=Candidatus Palauibacter sp. TaxID=3101350 RepID=UPI003B02A2C0
MSDKSNDKSNRIVNIAILATIAILLLNPSGVVGRWISTAYREWEERQRVAGVWDELVAAPSVLGSRGDPGGVIVEFADYDCPACRLVAPTVIERTTQGGATVVVRHLSSQQAGSPGREAARAAICADRQGRFALAHEALMTDDSWLDTRDWAGLAASIGIADLAAFNTCLNDESAERRLLRDRILADTLKIPGTPTYVTTQGLHVGVAGFAAASRAVAEIRDARSQEGPAARRLGGESIFDSARDLDPAAAALVAANVGFFLRDTHFVIVDRTEMVFVDPASGDVRTVGGEGSGPGEFNHILGAMRTPEGVAAWDLLSQRISFFSSHGEFLRSRGYDPLSFRHVMANPVAVHPEGDILFRDGGGATDGMSGPTWNPARYVALRRDGQLRTVATAKGDELFFRTLPGGGAESERVVFGHRTFEGAAGEFLVVAPTEAAAIQVMDWSGRVRSSIPMPEAVKVTPHQIRMARDSIAAARKRRFALAAAALGPPQGFPELEAIPNLPANEEAPAIDRLFVDFDERLWVREYRLPNQDSVIWQVWDIERARQLFTVQADGDAKLLDARGEMVLLRHKGAFDVPRIVARRIVPG